MSESNENTAGTSEGPEYAGKSLPAGQFNAAIKNYDAKTAQRLMIVHAEEVLGPTGLNSFVMAARLGQHRVCEWMVGQGLNLNQVIGSQRLTLLLQAVRNREYGVAAILLRLGANPSSPSMDGVTPLHLAARTGQEYLIRRLVKYGAEVDAVDKRGRTPLRYALDRRRLTTAKLLLGLNSDPEIKDHRGKSALAVAEQLNLEL